MAVPKPGGGVWGRLYRQQPRQCVPPGSAQLVQFVHTLFRSMESSAKWTTQVVQVLSKLVYLGSGQPGTEHGVRSGGLSSCRARGRAPSASARQSENAESMAVQYWHGLALSASLKAMMAVRLGLRDFWIVCKARAKKV